jgi:predicted alpha/beta-hydrolase family hydrolase
VSERDGSADAIHLTLGHGASGNSESMRPYVEGLAKRGIVATAIDLPKRKAEDAVDAYEAQLPAAGRLAVGGQSFGGRVASLLAARRPMAGLVLFCYPLHRPGAPELGLRVEHLPAITCPILFLSGEADPFARIDLLRETVASLPKAELVTYPRLGHGLLPKLDDVLDHVARFLKAV